MSECHKMQRIGVNPDGTELWSCSAGCDFSWLVIPSEQGPPKRDKVFGRTGDYCHTFGYEVQKDDLVLSMGVGDD